MRSKQLFDQALASLEHDSFSDQRSEQALVQIAIRQVRAKATDDAVATVELLEKMSQKPFGGAREFLNALVGIGVELAAFDRVAAAAAFDRAIQTSSSTHDLKRIGVAEAQAGLPDQALRAAMTIFRVPPSEKTMRIGFVFSSGSIMEIPDILDELIERNYLEQAKQVVALCSRTLADVIRGCDALSRLFPEQAPQIAGAVANLIA
jgi:hypothetical protein